ncbi:Glycerophosphoryl diester phosphodiesterase [Lachnospiraceae bacterium C7]|nr:Glycerophosphoryl diester phosphodiesterase [Lachnospiraceae bacterium C7]
MRLSSRIDIKPFFKKHKIKFLTLGILISIALIIFAAFSIGKSYENGKIKKLLKLKSEKVLIDKKYFEIDDVMNILGYRKRKNEVYTGKIDGQDVTVFWDFHNKVCRKNSYKYDISGEFLEKNGVKYVNAKALKKAFFLDFSYKNGNITYKECKLDKWYKNNPLVAHAGGAVREKSVTSCYTNSRDAFVQNYNLGHRVFEFDIYPTADNQMALIHDWDKFGMKNGQAFSTTEWKNFRGTSKPDYGHTFTTMMLSDILDQMLINKDMYLITDTKSTDFTMDEAKIQFQELYNEAMKRDPELLDRIIPQIYNEDMYSMVMSVYKFKSIIYTTYATKDSAKKIIIFSAKHNNIQVITVKYKDKRFGLKEINMLHFAGKLLYNHTIDTYKKYTNARALGADGAYTNVLTPEDGAVYDNLTSR